jgi:hypothetical protein
MSEQEIENWMHASDEERNVILSGLNADKDEGRDLVESIALLLQKECVYDVTDVEAISTGGTWQILAHADSDYDSLKDRDIDFLGFKLVFQKSAG